MNKCWIDVETTGRYADKHDVIQLACIPMVNGVRGKSFNEFCQPINWDAIEEEAIKVHGIQRKQMRTFQMPSVMLDLFIKYLKSFNTKFVISGYNVDFDRQFISQLFMKHGRSADFFGLFELQIHDTFARVKTCKHLFKTDSNRLSVIAEYCGIAINAHDALSDIEATIAIDDIIAKEMGEEFISTPVVSESTGKLKFLEPAQLHVHSSYDIHESIPTIKEWDEWCENNNVPGFSTVDHGFAGALFHMRGKNIKEDKTEGPVHIPGCGLYFLYQQKICSFNAWAVNTAGYYNLMKLASLGYDNVVEVDGIKRPVLEKHQIKQYSKGLMFGVSDVYGPIGQALLNNKAQVAQELFDGYVDLFGKKNLIVEFNPVDITYSYSSKMGYVNVKRNELIVDGNWNKAYNIFLAQQVDAYNLFAIPVSGANFINPEDKILQDVVCRNSFASGTNYIESYHAKNAIEMYLGLKNHLGEWLDEAKFNKWIVYTHGMVEKARSIEIQFDYHLPKIEIPEHIKAMTADYNQQTLYYTFEKCRQHGRWNDDPIYKERLQREIDVIMNNKVLNFLPYFLLYEDISAYARSIGLLQGIGRGSAGGSLLSYYLKIIHIDPIAADLPFERFLSHSRIGAGSFPDIDADFGNRGPIVDYIEKKYGLGFAQICVYQKMKAKTAIKDAMWALYGKNRKDPYVEGVCKLIPDSPQGTDEHDFLYGYTDKEGLYHLGVVESIPEIAAFFKQFSHVETIVKKLIGLTRSVGRHASAFVVSTLDLGNDRLPLMKVHDNKGQVHVVTQYDAPMVEACGLVKADILVIDNLSMVSDCMNLIKERRGVDYLLEDDKGMAAIYTLPEDSGVYKDFYNKKTDSSFQYNTPTVKTYIQDIAPISRADLSTTTALLRPGAMDAPMYDTTAAEYYIDVRNGRRDVEYIHDDLKHYTSNAIFIYQEQIMKFLVDIAGYTLEESDIIRNAIAKKKQSVIQEAFQRVRDATALRGWTAEQAQVVCNQIQAFAKYSFNLSHSRCYAELGYITMFLKHHYKLEWWCSVLNNTDKEDKLRHHMSVLGDLIRSPTMAAPSSRFVIHGDKIVAPLHVIKGIGTPIVKVVEQIGPINSLQEYLDKIPHGKLNRSKFIGLVKARALDHIMDPTLPYSQARSNLINNYLKARKNAKPFSVADMACDPVSAFLAEREVNTCFNKSILSDSLLVQEIMNLKPDLQLSDTKGIPFFDKTTPVISSLILAENLVSREYDKEVGMFLLFQESSIKQGISKKSGKSYLLMKAMMNDGFSEVECTMWDRAKPLRFPVNSIVYVKGKLKTGWRTNVGILITDVELVK